MTDQRFAPEPAARAVQGCCPACGRASLTLGTGGYVVCGHLECPDPEEATRLLGRGPELERYAEGTERPVLWSVYNRMHGRAATAEAALDAHRVALSDALGLGTSAPWDAIEERARELAAMNTGGGKGRTASDVLVEHDVTRKALCDALDVGYHLNWQQIVAAAQRHHDANGEWQRESEEHRRQLAGALCEAEHADWSSLLRRAEQVWEGRSTWREKAQKLEADRDRLAVQLTNARAENDGLAESMRNTDRLTTAEATELRRRAGQAEAGRIAADNVIRATLAALGVGPDTDPVIKARETLARAERAEIEATRAEAEVKLLHGNDEVNRRESSNRRTALATTLKRGPGADWHAVHAAAAEYVRRAATAEATLARVRRIAKRLTAQAVAFQDVLDDTDRDPWARTIRTELDALRAALDGAQPAAEPEPAPAAPVPVLDAFVADIFAAFRRALRTR